MTIEELVEQARTFSIPQEQLLIYKSEREDFIRRFPIDSLGNLSPTDYAGIGNRHSFINALEHKVREFGIGGGTAGKFGIYQGKDESFFLAHIRENA